MDNGFEYGTTVPLITTNDIDNCFERERERRCKFGIPAPATTTARMNDNFICGFGIQNKGTFIPLLTIVIGFIGYLFVAGIHACLQTVIGLINELSPSYGLSNEHKKCILALNLQANQNEKQSKLSSKLKKSKYR